MTRLFQIGYLVSRLRGETLEKLHVLHSGASSYINPLPNLVLWLWKAKCQGLWCKGLCCSAGKLSTQAGSQSNCPTADNTRSTVQSRTYENWNLLRKNSVDRTQEKELERFLSQRGQVLAYIYPRNFQGGSMLFQINSKHPHLGVL